MSDERPESLLKSALEKIVYFEARSTQLTNDLDRERGEAERLKGELGQAAQREIELRRVIAELEVRTTRAHGEREESARLVDALRRERADLIGKMLDASRIHGAGDGLDDFDLAQFIAQLRSEVLLTRDGPVMAVPAPSAPRVETPAPAAVAKPVEVEAAQPRPSASAAMVAVTRAAHELSSQGRLSVSPRELDALTGARTFPGRSEETLFGFSVRELSAPDTSARARAAERLLALAHPAAAPALASALHSETEPSVQVALLAAFSSLAKAEGVPVVQPLLTSRAPDVRIAALKALLTLDAAQAGPHLAAAMSDPDKAVRRRASLLALGLDAKQALELGTKAIRDADPDVRALAALVLGASQADAARPMLLDAMRDADLRVRRSASQALSRLLGRDVTALVGLDDAQRRREVRRLAHLPAKAPAAPLPTPAAGGEAPAHSEAARRIWASLSGVSGAPAQAAARTAPAQPTSRSSGAFSASAARQAALASSPSSVPAARPVKDAALAAGSSRLVGGAGGAPASSARVVKETALASSAARPVGGAPASGRAAAPVTARAAVAVLEEDAPPPPSAELCAGVLRELRAAIRGQPLQELAQGLAASTEDTMRACAALMQQGQVVRRGLKYFVA